MSASRVWVVAVDELRLTLRRPLTWVLIALLLFLSYGLSAGWVQIAISSGDASVGGTRAHLTSEFALTQIFAAFSWSAYIFFAAAGAGLGVIRDGESRVLEILQSTPLRPAEYAWGKYLGVLAAFVVVLIGNTLVLMVCLAVLPNAEMLDARGPFVATNYLKPLLVFGLPNVIFMTGMAFAVGTATRRAVLVFAFPVALLLLCLFFLWDWSPSWLSEGANRALMFIDPSGLRWLRETWLEVDRGAAFYNTQAVTLDGFILGQRATWVILALLSVAGAVHRFARTMRASHRVTSADVATAMQPQLATAPVAVPSSRPLPVATGAPPTWWTTLRMVAAAEARELAAQPGLYLFVPLVVLQVISNALLALGAFDTPLLRTPGQLAATQMGLLTAYVTLLLVFYAVESLERERSTRLSAIHDSLPIPTSALLAGKAVALGVVVGVIVLACLLASMILVMAQGNVGFSLTPFVLMWVVLLIPTFFVVIAFIFAAYGIAKGRYGAYAISFGAIGLAMWAALTDRENWVSDWSLTSAIQWSDMSILEFDREALIWNRLFWLAVGVFLWRVATRLYPRVERDPVRWLQARTWPQWWRSLRPSVPFVLAPVILGAMAWRQVNTGPDGARAEKLGKDYWKKNLATWWNAPVPWVKDVDLDVRLDPAERAWRVQGSYLVVNHRDTVLQRIPLTVGRWRNMQFTADGDSIRPDTASHLYVFTLPTPLGPGDSVRLGFSYEGRHEGATRAGGGAGEFIVPSGVVMQGWSPQYFPVVGFVEGIGSDEDNTFEPRDYPEDHWQATTPALFGSERPMTVRTRIDVPAAFHANGVGEQLRDEVKDGRRLVEFRTDEPVMAYNIVAGKWLVRRGAGTALFHHPTHTYNVDEMGNAMDQARRWYGTWFGAYPWKELKVSEFPSLATYAQGFPTNITFSEGIGFLTKSEPKTNLAFLVTAHEIAHQWWGNMLQPGRGPGANILSEGMSHFATALLIEQVKGFRNGLEFRTRIESRYGDNRFADAERKLYRIDGSKQGDNTVTYDKGGWVFWMLADLVGREPTLRGMQDFIAKYRGSDDHAMLQDFTAHMRRYAADTASYDDFVRQWFDSVVVGEYRVDMATTSKRPDGTWETRAVVRNVGRASMMVDVAAVRGERFPDDTSAQDRVPYVQQVTRVMLPAELAVPVTMISTFEPQRVVVDPDVRVLQLRRRSAEKTIER
ncbi:MAG: ABC transporter permease [Gemmatimonadetes bacterium]|nr:ABC transporter permease [Gemmatimonadota bacterium]